MVRMVGAIFAGVVVVTALVLLVLNFSPKEWAVVAQITGGVTTTVVAVTGTAALTRLKLGHTRSPFPSPLQDQVVVHRRVTSTRP